MSNKVMLSTNIDVNLKKLLTSYCKKNGLKIQGFIEEAILDKMEDDIDTQIYLERKNEKNISFDEVLKQLKLS